MPGSRILPQPHALPSPLRRNPQLGHVLAAVHGFQGATEAWSAKPRKVRQFMLQTGTTGNVDLGELAVEGATLGDWAK